MDLPEAAKTSSEGIGESMESKGEDIKQEVAVTNLFVKREEEMGSTLGPLYGGNGMKSTSAMKNPSAFAQLTIFYNGTVNVYDAIPSEKAQAILLIAAAASSAGASSGNNTNLRRAQAITGPTSAMAAPPALTRSLSQQSSSTAASPQPPQLLANPSSFFCKLHSELPGARRHSLQRFLEKRRDRFVSKAPYCSLKNFEGMEASMDSKPELNRAAAANSVLAERKSHGYEAA